MKKFEKHVIDTRNSNNGQSPISYCGEKVDMQWCFQDAEHMLNNYKANGRLLPCPKCKKAILMLINNF